jgi:ubiquitin-protein ligase E3 A
LKKPLKIKYVGSGEEGLDLGGVQKEFFQLIMSQIFDPMRGLFVEQDGGDGVVWINGESVEGLQEFELVGVLLGLAVYNSVQLDLRFPAALYVVWFDRRRAHALRQRDAAD